jgi:serine protease Do
MSKHWIIGFLITAFLLAGACGQQPPEENQAGGNDDETTVATAVADTGAASSIGEAKDATIYIQASGGFNDLGRDFGTLAFGQGSGFIIDEEGVAVTNNHVVTGASYLNVYVEGDEEPRRAETLGASECSDLALIDIEEGGYPFAEWREGPIVSGLSHGRKRRGELGFSRVRNRASGADQGRQLGRPLAGRRRQGGRHQLRERRERA